MYHVHEVYGGVKIIHTELVILTAGARHPRLNNPLCEIALEQLQGKKCNFVTCFVISSSPGMPAVSE